VQNFLLGRAPLWERRRWRFSGAHVLPPGLTARARLVPSRWRHSDRDRSARDVACFNCSVWRMSWVCPCVRAFPFFWQGTRADARPRRRDPDAFVRASVRALPSRPARRCAAASAFRAASAASKASAKSQRARKPTDGSSSDQKRPLVLCIVSNLIADFLLKI
jgi:hypothetical protein